MKISRIIPAVLCLGLAAMLCVAAASAGGGLDVVNNKCSTCHELKRLCKGLELKDKNGWTANVDRMIEKRGARLSPQERVLAIGYLALQTPKTAPFCK